MPRRRNAFQFSLIVCRRPTIRRRVGSFGSFVTRNQPAYHITTNVPTTVSDSTDFRMIWGSWVMQKIRRLVSHRPILVQSQSTGTPMAHQLTFGAGDG